MCKRSFILAVVLTVLTGANVCQAQAPSLDRILPIVSRQLAGEMLDARGPIVSPDGKAHYEIKWLTPNGRVIWVSADAGTGKLLG
jgi:uncharacterized membrane protein YkoI